MNADALRKTAMAALEDRATPELLAWLSVRPDPSAWKGPNESATLNAIARGVRAYLDATLEATGWEKGPDGRVRVGKGVVRALRARVAELAKAYRALADDPTVAGMERLKAQFREFHGRFDGFLTESVLKPSAIGAADEPWAHKQLRAGAYAATTVPHDLFPDAYDHRTREHVPAPWLVKRDGAKVLRRWQETWRKALHALDAYLDHVGVLTLEPHSEQIDVAGVRVVVFGQGRDGEGREAAAKLPRVMALIRKGAEQIRAAGFGAALRGLVVHVRLTAQRTERAAATYDRGLDVVTLLPWAIYSEETGEFVHEVGHRFYYRAMQPDAVEAWNAHLRTQQGVVHADHLPWAQPYVERFFAEVKDGELRGRELAPRQWRLIGAQWADRLPEGLSPVERARLRWMVSTAAERGTVAEAMDSLAWWTREPEMHRSVAVEPTAEPDAAYDYGAWKPEEAFAEAFRLYVTKGPRALGPWTRAFFRDAVQAGGAARLRYNPS